METANHTPITFKNLGKTNNKIIINSRIQKNNITIDTFPLKSTVNKTESKY